MPTIIIDGYKFRFFTKIWLQSLEVEYNHGYSKPELNKVVKLARENRQKLLEVWNDYFSQ